MYSFHAIITHESIHDQKKTAFRELQIFLETELFNWSAEFGK